MKPFLDKDFLLYSDVAKALYHDYAAHMPVIDYHCHLSPQQIADDIQFENITQAWLYGDHYKWRAMRTNGVAEDYITGNKNDWEKFEKWATTVPYTLRNPLYHWTHLELQRYFNINNVLNENSAIKIYKTCNELITAKDYSTRNLLKKMHVEIVCTTDDPIDTLQYHKKIKEDGFEINILPAFRPDKAMDVASTETFYSYVQQLQNVSNISITTFEDYLSALKSRHDFFHANGCRISDHGLENMYATDFTDKEINNIFNKLISKNNISEQEQQKIKSAMLLYFAEWDHEKNWVQQFHLGAMRNNNSRMMKQLGADAGWDSIGDFSQANALASFLNTLDKKNKLAKTIIYNLNPADNEIMASIIGNFNDGSVAGKIQWGSAWWFLDQKDGITKQLNALSNMSLLSRFIGMLTDSRSFLSFPRHEYFRRILCNLFGDEIEKGELPNDIKWAGKIIQDICYYNAKNYFDWKV
ncbi:MAG: glucuronate isomerase [Parafilimonas sp.]